MNDRRAIGGRGTDQYNMGLRDPMVHQIKGQFAEQRALTGMGTSATQYRQLQNAAHAHMRGGRPQLAGGGFISDLGIPFISNLAGMVGLGRGAMSGGAMSGGAMSGGAMSGGAMNDGMFTERQLMGLARAVGGGQPLGRTHSKMMNDIKGAGFFDDFQKGFMSVIRPLASIVKPLLPLAGPYGAAGAAGLSALGLGRGRGDDMVETVGGRRRRAKASPTDGRRARGAMVSQLMRERGMTLGQASKFIKEQGS